ncbi:MAG TPA: hypothetical protein DCE26_10635, partial [Dehalococcoidia bacterium]|nr:hypothetical protein [Dehalococcoidia bacterium]
MRDRRYIGNIDNQIAKEQRQQRAGMVLVTYTIEHTEGRHRFVAEERGEKIPERLLAKLWRER